VLVWAVPPPLFPTAYHPLQLFLPDTERSVFIEDSNLAKVAKAAAENGSLVVDLTAGGWTLKPVRIAKVAEILKYLKLVTYDTIVIDAMA
jgi:hypothetical protein